MHSLWQRAIGDLTLDQVNHHERTGVVPLAFSFLHLITTEDRVINEALNKEMHIWESGDWANRIGGEVPPVRRGAPLEVAESVRFGDLAAWMEYQTAVFTRTETVLADMADERYDEIFMPKVPETMRGGFIAMVAGDGPLYLGDYLELVIYQHGIRHIGEVEHARALVGLRGLD